MQLLAAYTVQSMHAGIQHPCVPYMTSRTIHTKKSYLQAAATIQERLMCRYSVAKVRLQFESGICSRVAFAVDASYTHSQLKSAFILKVFQRIRTFEEEGEVERDYWSARNEAEHQ